MEEGMQNGPCLDTGHWRWLSGTVAILSGPRKLVSLYMEKNKWISTINREERVRENIHNIYKYIHVYIANLKQFVKPAFMSLFIYCRGTCDMGACRGGRTTRGN